MLSHSDIVFQKFCLFSETISFFVRLHMAIQKIKASPFIQKADLLILFNFLILNQE